MQRSWKLGKSFYHLYMPSLLAKVAGYWPQARNIQAPLDQTLMGTIPSPHPYEATNITVIVSIFLPLLLISILSTWWSSSPFSWWVGFYEKILWYQTNYFCNSDDSIVIIIVIVLISTTSVWIHQRSKKQVDETVLGALITTPRRSPNE